MLCQQQVFCARLQKAFLAGKTSNSSIELRLICVRSMHVLWAIVMYNESAAWNGNALAMLRYLHIQLKILLNCVLHWRSNTTCDWLPSLKASNFREICWIMRFNKGGEGAWGLPWRWMQFSENIGIGNIFCEVLLSIIVAFCEKDLKGNLLHTKWIRGSYHCCWDVRIANWKSFQKFKFWRNIEFPSKSYKNYKYYSSTKKPQIKFFSY